MNGAGRSIASLLLALHRMQGEQGETKEQSLAFVRGFAAALYCVTQKPEWAAFYARMMFDYRGETERALCNEYVEALVEMCPAISEAEA